MIETRVITVAAGPRAQHRAACDCGWHAWWVYARPVAERREADHLAGCEKSTGPRLLGRFVAGSAAWHQARMGGLGGSEVAAVLGMSPWESAFSLWHRKSGLLDMDRVNDEIVAGTLLEPVIVRRFAAEHPDFAVRPNSGTWAARSRPWQISNPDALLMGPDGVPALFEAKFSLYADGFGEQGTDEIPPYYAVQVQWYLDVFGLAVAWLMVFVGSSAQFRTYRIEADPVRQAELREAAVEFLDTVAAGERPDIDGHNATYEVVRDLHPNIDDGDVPVPADIAVPFCQAKHAVKAAELEAKRATAVLADHMGTAQRAIYAGRTIARRQAKGGGVPYVQAERNLPEFTTESETTAIQEAS